MYASARVLHERLTRMMALWPPVVGLAHPAIRTTAILSDKRPVARDANCYCTGVQGHMADGLGGGLDDAGGRIT
jgi:hypothetical protein